VSIVFVTCVAVLGLIWLAYPVTVAGLARLRPRPSRQPGSAARTVSVIIASADEAAPICARLTDVLAADYPSEQMHVIVALDYASARAKPEDLSGFDARVTTVRGDAPGGKASTLNAAVRSSRGDVLVFTDTSQAFDPSAVSELVAALSEPRVGIVSGALELERSRRGGTLAHAYWRYERWLRANEARLHSGVGVTGAIYAMRRDLWHPLPAGLILDDVYTPMRLALDGWRIGFSSRAVAFDERRFTPAQEYRRKVRTLTGVIQLCAWLPAVLNPFRNPVWIQFVVHKLLRLLTPYLALVATLALVWELAAFVITSGRLSIVYVAMAAVALIFVVPRLRRALFAQLAWAWALQTSAVTASINGLKGNWNVWKQ